MFYKINKIKMKKVVKEERDKLLLRRWEIEFELDWLRTSEWEKFKALVAEREKLIFNLHRLIWKA